MSPEVILGRARDFMESRILLTGAELNLFTLLTPVPLSAQEVTARIGADLRGLTILLDALSAMGLLAKQAGKYHSPPSISPFLSAEASDSILPMILHMAHVWERWAGLTRIVKGVRDGENPTVPAQDAEELRASLAPCMLLLPASLPGLSPPLTPAHPGYFWMWAALPEHTCWLFSRPSPK